VQTRNAKTTSLLTLESDTPLWLSQRQLASGRIVRLRKQEFSTISLSPDAHERQAGQRQRLRGA